MLRELVSSLAAKLRDSVSRSIVSEIADINESAEALESIPRMAMVLAAQAEEIQNLRSRVAALTNQIHLYHRCTVPNLRCAVCRVLATQPLPQEIDA